MTPVTPPTPQKSKATPIVLIIIGIVLLLCLGSCVAAAYAFWWSKDKVEEIVDQIPTGPADPGENNTGSKHTVRYEVEGTGQAMITWAKVGGQGSETVNLPWNTELTVERDSFGLSVTAFAQNGGTLESCRIVVDGTERSKRNVANNVLLCNYVYVKS